MIRKEAVVHFAQDLCNNHGFREKAPFDHTAVIEMFPQFLTAFEFGRKLGDTGHEVIVTVDYHGVGVRKFALSNFRLLVGLEELDRQNYCPFHIVCDGNAMFEGVDERLSINPCQIRLKSGAELFIDFFCPGQEREGRRYMPWREARPMRNENNITAEDMSMMDTVSLMASTMAIDYISAGFQACDNDTSKLAPISYHLMIPDRVSAVHRIINTNYAGDNGENILVQNLMSGKTFGAFSRDFGSSQDWINAQQKRGANNGMRRDYEYTPEETEVLAAYSLVLKEAADGAPEKK